MTKQDIEDLQKQYDKRKYDLFLSCAFYTMKKLVINSENIKGMLLEKLEKDFKDNENMQDVKKFLLSLIEDYFIDINNAVELISFYNDFKDKPTLKGFNN